MTDTTRLVLSPLMPGDLTAFHALLVDPDVRRYLMDGQIVSRNWTRAQITRSVRAMKRSGLGLWAMRHAPHGAMIGVCGFHTFHDPRRPELMYALFPRYWGRGYANLAARLVCRLGFASGLGSIIAGAAEPNVQSIRVLERVGMQRVAKRPRRFFGREWRYRLPAGRFNRTRSIRFRSAVLVHPSIDAGFRR